VAFLISVFTRAMSFLVCSPRSLYLFVLLSLEELKFEGEAYCRNNCGSTFCFLSDARGVGFLSFGENRCAVRPILFLAFIFLILSLGKPLLIVLSGTGFALALMSKEMAVVFQLVALAFDLLRRRPWRGCAMVTNALYSGLLALFLYLRGRGFINLPELPHVRVLSDIRYSGSISGLAELLGLIKVILVSYLYYFWKPMFPFGFNTFIESVPAGVSGLSSLSYYSV
jgi:hypothetical protein